MSHNPPKIFCIGLPKTGTTSLAGALTVLGYRSFHNADRVNAVMGINLVSRSGRLMGGLDKDFDAFLDGQIKFHFPMLDENYPNSKFIYTVRDLDTWLVSMELHAIRESQIRGDKPRINPDRWLARYHWHQRAVAKYFVDMQDQLLTMDIIHGDGWEKLCPFFDKPIPPQPFPWLNKAT